MEPFVRKDSVDGDDYDSDDGDDDDMEPRGYETDYNPKSMRPTTARSRNKAIKKSKRNIINQGEKIQMVSSPAASSVVSPTPDDTYIMKRYGNFKKEMAQSMKTELEQLIKGIETRNWNHEEGRDFKSAEAELQLDPTSGSVKVFIKEVLDRSAWEREYENLFNLIKCVHVPIFYCSLENTEAGKFFIITEKCEEFNEEIDKLLLQDLPDYLDDFHRLDYFHGDLGNPENIMVAIRDGERKLVFIDLDDTYSLTENHTKDTELTEGKPLSRDDKISAFKFVETDNLREDEKREIFMACDRFSLMHSLLTLLGFGELLPGSGETHSKDGDISKGYNCLYETTHSFYMSFIPNFKIVITSRECRDSGHVGDGNIFWNLEDTLRLVPVFNACYDIFRENLREGRDPFDRVNTILQVKGSMKSSFARKKSKNKKTKRKKSRRKTNRKNKKLKTKKSRKKK